MAPHEAPGVLPGAVNITTILLVTVGLVLVTTILLSATALAAALFLGAFHWKWVVLAAVSGEYLIARLECLEAG
jgi:hypothetical protein